MGAEGKAQAKLLAEKLKSFLPFSLYSSEEPKAAETSKIISFILKLNWKIINGLYEIDRPAGPLLSQAEHRKLNQGIFEEPNRPVIGKESANQALDRFSRAVHKNILKSLSKNVVIVSHGTVISLFVEKYCKVDGFQLWKTLKCSSLVILDYPGYLLTRVIKNIG